MNDYNSSRRLFLKILSLGILFITLLIASLSCNKKIIYPNIILINVDDLGWTDLGCYGSRYYETPNIDQLASQGMRFTNAYSAASVCSPTRASIITGKYPARLGITDWIRAEFQGGGSENIIGYTKNKNKKLTCPLNPFHLELSEVTIAEILKKCGYSTCHIGKWHLGTTDWYPENQGFDINVAGCDYGQPPGYFDPYIMYPTHWYPDTLKGFPTMKSRKKGEYLTDREADEAINFIKNVKDNSFFLNLCHYAVHTPIQAKQELIKKYENKPVTNQKNPKYAAMIESVDASLGKIIRALEELNLMNNTIIIITSDNGGLLRETATNNTPLRLGKGYPYEGGIRVPLIIKWPSFVKDNSISEIPVISPDIFSTICDVVDFDISDDNQIDGKSLLPILNSTGTINRDAIFWHFPHYRGNDIKPYSIVRSDEWKLIKNHEEESFELYNLSHDISETQDLSQKYLEKVVELDKILTVWLTEVDAKLPRKNPNYTQPIQNSK
jgi:arylsulfatase A-like enzyme